MRILNLTNLMLVVPIVMGAQEAIQVSPETYRVVFENDWVRVINTKYRAHEKLPIHKHSERPTVYVYLTDSGPVRFSHIEEHAFQITRPPLKAGTFRVSPGRLEKHEVENLSDLSTEFLRIELKQVPLKAQPSSFRSKPSFQLERSGISTEYQDAYIQIQRAIAARGRSVACRRFDDRTLLIALSPTVVRMETPIRLNTGEVLWAMPSDVPCRLRGQDDGIAGHALLICLHTSAASQMTVRPGAQ